MMLRVPAGSRCRSFPDYRGGSRFSRRLSHVERKITNGGILFRAAVAGMHEYVDCDGNHRHRRGGGGTTRRACGRSSPQDWCARGCRARRAEIGLRARESTPLANAELVIEEVPVAAFCPACAVERVVEFPNLSCPVCGTLTPDIVRGRELEVTALEIEVS